MVRMSLVASTVFIMCLCVPPRPEIQEPAPPEAALPPDAPLELSFHFARSLLTGLHVEIEHEGLGHEQMEELIDTKPDTRVADDRGYIAIEVELPDEVRSAVIETIPQGPWQIYEGTQVACTGEAGEPVIVGMVIPHFGEETQLDEAGVDLASAEGEAYRLGFLDGSLLQLMVPIAGCNHVSGAGSLLWARPLSDPPPASTFEPLVGTTGRAATRTLDSPEWKAVQERVELAYGDDPPPVDVTTYTAGAWSPEAGPDAWHVVTLRIGDAMCNAGPDEGLRAVLWQQEGETLTQLHSWDGEIRPFLVSDLDADGAIEIVVLTDFLSEHVELVEIEAGSAASVKSTSVAYRDCPC